jgi:hypothetical protein
MLKKRSEDEGEEEEDVIGRRNRKRQTELRDDIQLLWAG